MKEDTKAIEAKLKNLTFIVILGFIITILLIVGLYFKNNKVSSTSSGTSAPTSEYDVSRMKEINGTTAAKLFDKEGTYVLYIGRSTCSVCVKLVPELNEVIDDLGVSINYLPLNSTFRTDFADLFDHLDIETTVNSNEGTFGELLEEYGYTPIVVVIQNGKMVDGFVGYRDSDTISTLLKKYM